MSLEGLDTSFNEQDALMPQAEQEELNALRRIQTGGGTETGGREFTPEEMERFRTLTEQEERSLEQRKSH